MLKVSHEDTRNIDSRGQRPTNQNIRHEQRVAKHACEEFAGVVAFTQCQNGMANIAIFSSHSA